MLHQFEPQWNLYQLIFHGKDNKLKVGWAAEPKKLDIGKLYRRKEVYNVPAGKELLGFVLHHDEKNTYGVQFITWTPPQKAAK